MSKADFIANVAKAGDMSNAEAKRVVELVFGEIEKGLKKSKKEGRYTIGTFGTFNITAPLARVATHARAKRFALRPQKACASSHRPI